MMAVKRKVRRYKHLLAEVADEFLKCRSLKHAWDDNPNFELNTAWPTNWIIPLRCVRCTSERFDFCDFQGALVKRRYRYADGYRTVKATSVELRAEMIHRRLIAQHIRGR